MRLAAAVSIDKRIHYIGRTLDIKFYVLSYISLIMSNEFIMRLVGVSIGLTSNPVDV